MSATGIPVEYLFLAIAGLIGIIYADLRSQVKSSAKAGARRDVYLIRICEKLKIHFDPDDS